jgi:hypothetical protein
MPPVPPPPPQPDERTNTTTAAAITKGQARQKERLRANINAQLMDETKLVHIGVGYRNFLWLD